MAEKSTLERLMTETWPARTAKGILEGLMLPGDVAQGRAALPSAAGIPGSSDYGSVEGQSALERLTNLAGTVMGGSYAAPPVAGGAGMGIRAYHGSPDANISQFDRPAYFSTSRKYADKFASGGKTYEVDVSPKNPYYTKDQMLIEGLRSFPERADALRKQGYDAVIFGEDGPKPILGLGGYIEPQIYSLDPSIVRQSGGIRAYHGSPHDFERFDMSKIGTGEGAQAYGHGLYFAENPAVASDYRKRLSDMSAPHGQFQTRSGGDLFAPQTDKLTPDWPKGLGYLIEFKTGNDIPYEALLSAARDRVTYFENGNFRGPLIAQQKQDAQTLVDWLKNNEGLSWRSNPDRGKMYEVNINAKPEQFLDWDKPLFKQGEIGRSAGDVAERLAGPNYLYNSSMGLSNAPAIVKNPEFTAAAREAGIPGIKYLDQGSRNAAMALKASRNPQDLIVPPQTSNYVLFRDDIIDIVKKYGILGALMAGGGAAGSDQAQAAP